MIDQAGCRGLTIGAAQVSEKHCNFLVNLGEATAGDIEGLGEEVRRRVLEKTGVQLEWEIRRIGEPAGESGAMTRVAVLMAAGSPEREVSLVSGKACAEGLREGGHEVVEYDVKRDLRALVDFLRPASGGGPDVVFKRAARSLR